MKYLQLALKVCEGCGTLWLRQHDEASVYCAACTLQLSRLPIIRTRHAGGRPACALRTRRARQPETVAHTRRCNGVSTRSAAKVGGAE